MKNTFTVIKGFFSQVSNLFALIVTAIVWQFLVLFKGLDIQCLLLALLVGSFTKAVLDYRRVKSVKVPEEEHVEEDNVGYNGKLLEELDEQDAYAR